MWKEISATLALVVPVGAFDGTSGRAVSDTSAKVRFLTEKYIDADVGVFMFHKSEQFREDFLMEANFNLAYDLISFARVFHSVWDIGATIGVGRQRELVFFDPRWLSIGVTPSVECRLRPLIVQVGLDRRCFHEVDRAPEKITTYWTQPYMLAGSPNMRPADYFARLFADDIVGRRERLSWYGKVGWFVKQLPGYSPSLTSGGHDYSLVVAHGVRYTPLRIRRWATTVVGRTNCHVDTAGGAFWTEEMEVHQTYRGDGFTMTLFAYLNLFDFQKPYKNMNRDRMAQVGARFF